MEYLNTTIGSVGGLTTWSMPIVSLVVALLCVIVILFAIYVGFRRFCYGACITALIAFIYKLSTYIGTSTSEGNYEPIRWFGWIAGFIICSFVCGYLVSRTKYIKKFEKETFYGLDNPYKQEKKGGKRNE